MKRDFVRASVLFAGLVTLTATSAPEQFNDRSELEIRGGQVLVARITGINKPDLVNSSLRISAATADAGPSGAASFIDPRTGEATSSIQDWHLLCDGFDVDPGAPCELRFETSGDALARSDLSINGDVQSGLLGCTPPMDPDSALSVTIE